MASINIMFCIKCDNCGQGDFALYLLENMNVRASCRNCLHSFDLKMAHETKKIRFQWSDSEDDSEGGN